MGALWLVLPYQINILGWLVNRGLVLIFFIGAMTFGLAVYGAVKWLLKDDLRANWVLVGDLAVIMILIAGLMFAA